MSDTKVQEGGGGFLYFVFCVCTTMIGQTINDNICLAIIDGIFAPLTWVKWFLCEDVTMSIIAETWRHFILFFNK